MSGGVGAYGCEAILCPPGTFNHGGRRQYTDDVCSPCEEKEKDESSQPSYLGQSTCGLSGNSVGAVVSSEGTEGSGNTAAESQSMERSVLEVIFDQTGGPKESWKSSDGWKTDTSFCTWYGIDCDENGSVASIQLGSNGLKGSIPGVIWTLPNLVHLKIYGNDVSIEFLGIEQARNLKTLGLDDTGLRNLDGIGKARSVTKLNISFNNLAGNLPEELSRLVNLETLDVSHNKFTGELPFWLRNFVSLTSLTASHNSLSGRVADFATLKKLAYVDLSNNQFGGVIPPTLLAGAVPENKVVVDLSDNKIEGSLPPDLGRLARLSIQLQENKISGIAPNLCNIDGWNDFGAMSFGCDGILCPAGTWNSLGRQSNEDVPCEPCSKATYMGSTTCGSATTTVASGASNNPTSTRRLWASAVVAVAASWTIL